MWLPKNVQPPWSQISLGLLSIVYKSIILSIDSILSYCANNQFPGLPRLLCGNIGAALLSASAETWCFKPESFMWEKKLKRKLINAQSLMQSLSAFFTSLTKTGGDGAEHIMPWEISHAKLKKKTISHDWVCVNKYRGVEVERKLASLL